MYYAYLNGQDIAEHNTLAELIAELKQTGIERVDAISHIGDDGYIFHMAKEHVDAVNKQLHYHFYCEYKDDIPDGVCRNGMDGMTAAKALTE